MGRECGRCANFKKWNQFHKKRNGHYGYDSRCKKCRKMERARRNKELKLQKGFFVDEENLVFDSEIVGEVSQEQITMASMIIAQAYKNRGSRNG